MIIRYRYYKNIVLTTASFRVLLQGKRWRRTTRTTATAPRAAGEASCTTTTSVSSSRSRALGNPCACRASAACAAWTRLCRQLYPQRDTLLWVSVVMDGVVNKLSVGHVEFGVIFAFQLSIVNSFPVIKIKFSYIL